MHKNVVYNSCKLQFCKEIVADWNVAILAFTTIVSKIQYCI